MRRLLVIMQALLLTVVAAALAPSANAACSSCQGEQNWDQTASNFLQGITQEDTGGGVVRTLTPQTERAKSPFLSQKNDASSATTSSATQSSNATGAAAKNSTPAKNDGPQRSASQALVLVPVESVNGSGIILDISPNSTEYIPGAISISYTNFLNEGGALKSVSEMAEVLGDAGISQDDPVLIYGECQPCGGGPSAATYVYWIMKYLGHQNLKLMDGEIDSWVAAKLPTVTTPSVLQAKNYTPTLKPELLATYEYVLSGTPQIVDARTSMEFEMGSIPGAVNIPYENVLTGKRIKDEAALRQLFSSLAKDRPVVVYTNTGVKASMVWFALETLGYDARLYSWQNWQAQQPRLNIALRKATADPNPAKTGDVVRLTLVFAEENQSSNAAVSLTSVAEDTNETVLTIKGCATCGFGSPQGFADLTSTGGVVQIGSGTSAKAASSDNGFKVSASVISPSGAQSGNVIMKRVSGDEFAGIWNANVPAGLYRVDVAASAGEVTKTFPDVLEIKVETGKYTKLGN
ncbi:MAG: putative thiosulfate sulfurtransferase [Methanosaeta sp. PtaU1.Bin060]|nr:MAG: putative thiosulfate sulfurtransferase [Methanosaeta sp. PtaU1.Bin060]